MTAKILDVTADEYHRLPGLSSTVAKVLLAQSPLHAQAAHGKRPTAEMDRGTVVHALALGAGKSFVVLDFDDWRTKLAKEARDEARAQGLTPILEKGFAAAQTIALSVIGQLAERGINLDGHSELAVSWTEKTEHGDVACRGMMDHVWLDKGVILDLKITEDASPESIERTAENMGYAIQAAAYTRAIAALKPELAGRVKFLFAFCEPEWPYAMNLVQPDGIFRELGERRWMRAVNLWGKCTKTNTWPGYGTGVNYLNPPAWALAREGYTTEDR